MRYIALVACLVALPSLGRVATAAEPLPVPRGPVILTITGAIEQKNAPGEARFDREMLESLGMASFTTSSQVSKTPQKFEGIPLRAVLQRVGANGKAMHAVALNAYEISIPFEDLRFEPILATHVDGQLLTMRDKGPLWIAYPRDAHRVLEDVRYDSRWVWQLHRLLIE